MNLSDPSIGSFRELWKKQYGAELTEPKAREYAERWLGFVQLLIDPEFSCQEKKKPP